MQKPRVHRPMRDSLTRSRECERVGLERAGVKSAVGAAARRGAGTYLKTANAGPRTVPVRSGIAGANAQECSRPPRPSDVLRAGTAGGDRPRSGGSAKMRPRRGANPYAYKTPRCFVARPATITHSFSSSISFVIFVPVCG